MTELSLGFGGLEGGCVRAPLGGLASELPCCQQAWSCGAGACGRSHGHSRQGPRGEALSRDPLPPVCGRGTPGLQACGADRHPGLFHDLGYLQIQPEPGDRPKAPPAVPSPSHCLLLHRPLNGSYGFNEVLLIKFTEWGQKLHLHHVEQRGARVLADETDDALSLRRGDNQKQTKPLDVAGLEKSQGDPDPNQWVWYGDDSFLLMETEGQMWGACKLRIQWAHRQCLVNTGGPSVKLLLQFLPFQGFRVVLAEDCWLKSLVPLMGEVRQQMGGRPIYISFDIDGLDPAYAPGTGTPEIAGLTPSQVRNSTSDTSLAWGHWVSHIPGTWIVFRNQMGF